ncbi:MAG: chitobiase/beta-hexosaminidase C-terminal domain-containing protein [Deltaproteobacteria bacterium]|nr:chitobiase/beta-hexosaminidase C-terminal domain-containing protein [Deltaproteobacteria bacterium]
MRLLKMLQTITTLMLVLLLAACGSSTSEPEDTTAPVTGADPAGGNFATAVSVSLNCSDGNGSGCLATFYTTDGSTPDQSSSVYSSAISISADTVLKFLSVDNAGNEESVRTESYTIGGTVDTTAPVTTAAPVGGSYTAAQNVSLTCNDGAGSGCAATYYTTDGSDPTSASTARGRRGSAGNQRFTRRR